MFTYVRTVVNSEAPPNWHFTALPHEPFVYGGWTRFGKFGTEAKLNATAFECNS